MLMFHMLKWRYSFFRSNLVPIGWKQHGRWKWKPTKSDRSSRNKRLCRGHSATQTKANGHCRSSSGPYSSGKFAPYQITTDGISSLRTRHEWTPASDEVTIEICVTGELPFSLKGFCSWWAFKLWIKTTDISNVEGVEKFPLCGGNSPNLNSLGKLLHVS